MDEQNQTPEGPLSPKITRRQLLSAVALAPLALAAGAFVVDLSPDEVVPEIMFPELTADAATGEPRLSAFFLASDTLELVNATLHASFLDAEGRPLEERDVTCYRDLAQGPYVAANLETPLPDGVVAVACDEEPVSWQYGDMFELGGRVGIVPTGYRRDRRGFLVADVLVNVLPGRYDSSSPWPLESLECDLVAYRGAGWFGTPCRATLLTEDDDPILLGEQRRVSVTLPVKDATRCEWRGADWREANMWERNRSREYPFEEVSLGSYRGQALTWLVLEETGDQATLISKYAVETAICYDDPHGSQETAWSVCTLNSWLNGKFLDDAFSGEERALLVPDEQGAAATLLSVEQFDKHFAGLDPRDRMAFSLSGLHTENYDPNNGSCTWWLFDTEEDLLYVDYVDGKGDKTFSSPRNLRGVRPVIIVKKGEVKKRLLGSSR